MPEGVGADNFHKELCEVQILTSITIKGKFDRMNKNKKLIRTLKRERRKLYPYGLPIQPRGCGKTYLHLSHFLRYIAYDFACNTYKNVDRKVSIEEAREYINSFISEIWQTVL